MTRSQGSKQTMSGYCGLRVLVGLCTGMALATPVVADACKVIDPELQESYQGGCRHGLAQGKGVARGTAVYEGGFNAGLKQGRGEKYWASGDRYVGGFHDDKKHGIGVYVWGAHTSWAGERYEGEFREDRRDGWGVYFWPNGDRYEGAWVQDKRMGLSVLEIRRKQAQAAHTEAYAAGAKVCWLAAPPGVQGSVKGVAEAYKEGVLSVRLSAPAASAGASPASIVVQDAAADWTLCQ